MKRLTNCKIVIVKIININSLTLTRNTYSCLIKNEFDKFISVIIMLVLLRPIKLYYCIYVGLFVVYFFLSTCTENKVDQYSLVMTTYQYRIIQA